MKLLVTTLKFTTSTFAINKCIFAAIILSFLLLEIKFYRRKSENRLRYKMKNIHIKLLVHVLLTVYIFDTTKSIFTTFVIEFL